jgi:2-polyprenyl-3-methyl-5-hydroxy-6-metoxy-1,4-benzoquinol methylase
MPLTLYSPNSQETELAFQKQPSARQIRKNSLQAQWDRYWKNPIPATLLKIQRRQWMFSLLKSCCFHGKGLVIGCEDGSLMEPLVAMGMTVDGCDSSKVALELAKKRDASQGQSQLFHECFPFTRLRSHSYEAVYLLELIADIEPSLHRIGVSELARICHKQGYVILSTALNRKSPDALDHLLRILQTEFDIVDLHLRYDHLDAILEKLASYLALASKLMNRFFYKGKRAGYALVICKPRPFH